LEVTSSSHFPLCFLIFLELLKPVADTLRQMAGWWGYSYSAFTAAPA
jgi:hypothetical protein